VNPPPVTGSFSDPVTTDDEVIALIEAAPP
jgi:hypothetical protein